jgi:predicted ferric reductase
MIAIFGGKIGVLLKKNFVVVEALFSGPELTQICLFLYFILFVSRICLLFSGTLSLFLRSIIKCYCSSICVISMTLVHVICLRLAHLACKLVGRTRGSLLLQVGLAVN